VKGRLKEQKGIEYYMGLPYSILLHEVEDESEKYWIAEVPELPGCKSHGSTVEEAVNSVKEAKKDWILNSLKSEEEVPIPIERDKYSGKLLVRMSHSLHKSLAVMADAEKLSLNQLIVTILAKEVGRLNVLNRVEDKVDSLLKKIDQVLEKEGMRMPFLNSIRVMTRAREREEYIIFDTDQTLEDSSATAAVRQIVPGFVTTASPLEELLKDQHLFQYTGQPQVIFSVPKRSEEYDVKPAVNKSRRK
jgi:antitoxin HicB